MKFILLELGKYEVRHDNKHLCGFIEYDYMWRKFYFRVQFCGLDWKDCRIIHRFMRKLNRKYR